MSPGSKSIAQEPRVTFLGAVQTVTGSMHLVEFRQQRLLLDCGMAREEGFDHRSRPIHFPFDPTTIDAVILTHAHMDHCGNLPNLVRQGFQGPIYCTPATRDLIAIMLADSARIQDEEVKISQHLGKTPDSRAGYTTRDVAITLDQTIEIPYGQMFEVSPSIRVRFHDAGHILGSAMAHLELDHPSRRFRITFTGDLGRRGLPFISEPTPVPPADLLISESTYGGKRHDTIHEMAEKMSAVFRRTLNRGGKLLVPAFSLGRTQIVVHYIQRWMQDGILPSLPIFVDSPLASDIAEVYQNHTRTYHVGGESGQQEVSYIKSADESKEISLRTEPMVLVASGGMCDGGRITGHLRKHIDDPRSTVVLVSYQAPNSLGQRLLEMNPTVRFHGRTWNKWIDVAQITGFSGHADQNDFLSLYRSLLGQVRHIRLVHGEVPQAEALAAGLRDLGFADVLAPQKSDVLTLE